MYKRQIQDGDLPHPAGDGVQTAPHLGHHAPGDEAGLNQLLRPSHVNAVQGGLAVVAVNENPSHVGEENEPVGPQGLGHRPGGVVGVAVEALAVLPQGDGGHHGEKAPVQQGAEHLGVDPGDGAHPAQGRVLHRGGEQSPVLSGDAHRGHLQPGQVLDNGLVHLGGQS